MNLIQVLPIGCSGPSADGSSPPGLANGRGGASGDAGSPLSLADLCAALCAELAAELRVPCEVVDGPFDPSPARHPERLQFHSTELLARMERLFRQRTPRVRVEAGSQLPEAGEQLPVAGGRLPEAERQLLVSGSWFLETGKQLSEAGSRLSETSNQQPAGGNQLPEAGSRLPETGNRLPTTAYRLPSPEPRIAPTDYRLPSTDSRLLGVTSLDLYIPTLTFVFGEAQLHGPCALVSTHRLRQEFYGLPPDPRLAAERLLKEAVHELGHTLGLRHCDDYRCAMAPSHGVEWIDLKSSRLCPDCQSRAASL